MLLCVSVKKKDQAFRFSAYRVFLTYARTLPRFKPPVVLRHLKKLVEKNKIVQYLISIEDHSDGGKHIHAYLKVRDKFDSKNSRFMDIKFYNDVYHPNVAAVTQVHKLWEYIKKRGDYITNIDETRPVWKVIVEESKSKTEFIESLIWHYGWENQYLNYRLLSDLWKEKKRFKYRE